LLLRASVAFGSVGQADALREDDTIFCGDALNASPHRKAHLGARWTTVILAFCVAETFRFPIFIKNGRLKPSATYSLRVRSALV